MNAGPRMRKLLLTAHVASSVGWLGAVVVFLALSVVGLTGQEPQARGAYLAMESIGWLVLVPMSVASLLTGFLQSLATKWGLLRHYWVMIKLGITVVATIVLLLYMQTLSYLAGIAAQPGAADGGLRDPSPVLHAAAALLLLVGATVLSVYKPSGMTRYGRRRQRERRAASQPTV